jgi:hypothetical protein
MRVAFDHRHALAFHLTFEFADTAPELVVELLLLDEPP